jgi:hypothetical protein
MVAEETRLPATGIVGQGPLPVASLLLEDSPQPQNGAPQPTANVVEVSPPAYRPMGALDQPEERPQRLDNRSLLARALEKIQFRKRAKLERIMKFATEKKSINNDQVEKLLHVSHRTASRYLGQLVMAGRLQQVGPDERAEYQAL